MGMELVSLGFLVPLVPPEGRTSSVELGGPDIPELDFRKRWWRKTQTSSCTQIDRSRHSAPHKPGQMGVVWGLGLGLAK